MKRLSVLVAVVLVVLMVHARGGSAVGVSPLASCTPDCTGVADQTQIPDPYNCTSYYICVGGIDRGPFSCPDGNEFSEDDGGCVSSGTEACQPLCGGANCPLTCNGTLSAIGSAFDCNIYYFCTPNGPSPEQTCDDDNYPYYNGNTFSCSNDPSVCCNGYCTAHCSGPGLTPDPKSCTGYYVCLEEGDVDELLYDECGAGQVFSVGLGDCVEDTGEPCITLCSVAGGDGGGGISTSTTTSTTTTSGGGGDSTDANGCVSSLVCSADGDFPACSTCQQEYFHCSAAGAMGESRSCPDGYVFDTNPEYANCVLPSHCPSS